MKLIYHMVKINLDNKEKEWLLINTLFGSVDVIKEEQSLIIDKWINQEHIVPISIEEEQLYEQLVERKYLILSIDEEIKTKEKLLYKLRVRHESIRKNSSSVTFVLTYDCNFACPYCYEKTNSMSVNVITKEMVDKVFDIYNNNINNITFFGGEPLLSGNIEIIEYIISKAPNATYSIFTNGYLLSDFISIIKKIKIGVIQVTLDGSSEIHNKTRVLKSGEPTYNKIIEGIKCCLESSIPVKIRMNISNNNVNNCIELIEKINNEYEHFKSLISFELQPLFQLHNKDKIELEKKIYWDKDDKNMINRNVILKSALPILKLFTLNTKKISPLYCNCDAEKHNMFFDANGKMYSCILSVGDEKSSVGTYYPEYIPKNNSLIYRNIETIPECLNCKLAFICGGGCGYASIGEEGDVFRPNCYQINKDLYKTIPMLYKMNC